MGFNMQLNGIHHITCITADAPRNVDLYARALGLRLIEHRLRPAREEPDGALVILDGRGEQQDATRPKPVYGPQRGRRDRPVDRNQWVQRRLGGVERLELDGWDVAEGLVQPIVVEPADVLTVVSSTCDLVRHTRSAISYHAVGGGIVRDLLLRQVANILRTDRYAVPALLAATVLVVAHQVRARSALFPLLAPASASPSG